MRAVIFDMYGVIIREAKGNLQPYISGFLPGITEEEVYAEWKEVSQGFIAPEQFLSGIGLTGDLALIQRGFLDQLTLDEDIYEACRILHEHGIKTALLSNDVGSWNDYLREKFALNALFDAIVVSGDVGMRKPMPQIYALMLERLAFEARECIFIDDQMRNLNAAREAGLNTLHYHEDGECQNLIEAVRRIIKN